MNCPNCGQPIAENTRVCPHCGFLLPPLPTHQTVDNPDAPALLTKNNALDMLLGLLTPFLLGLLVAGSSAAFQKVSVASYGWYGFGGGGLPTLVSVILYFVIKSRYPVYAKGLKIILLIELGLLVLSVVLVLGALAVCALIASGSHR